MKEYLGILGGVLGFYVIGCFLEGVMQRRALFGPNRKLQDSFENAKRSEF